MFHHNFLGAGQLGNFHIPRFSQGNIWSNPKFGLTISFLDMDVNRLLRVSFVGEKETAIAFYFKYFWHGDVYFTAATSASSVNTFAPCWSSTMRR